MGPEKLIEFYSYTTKFDKLAEHLEIRVIVHNFLMVEAAEVDVDFSRSVVETEQLGKVFYAIRPIEQGFDIK